MADFYLDPEGGNDANAGTSFALRKKTLAAITSGMLAAGDRIKVIASLDPYSVGNGTWTDNSDVVTLAAAKTQTVHECDSGWVAGANCTINHYSFLGRDGSMVSITPNSTAQASPGQVFAYAPTAANLDLSAYQAISLFFTCGSAKQSVFVLDLCSDAAGAVPLLSLPVLLNPTANGIWQCMLLENAGNLPSGINSIALRSTSAYGTYNDIYIDNIIACKAKSDANHLSHSCFIGKKTAGEPEWYPIRAIKGTTVRVGNLWIRDTATRPYRGTTETVDTYVQQPIRYRHTAAEIMLQKGGTSDTAMITLSGGWDRSAMSTQSGETWLSQTGGGASCWHINDMDYVAAEKIGYAHTSGVAINSGFATRARVDIKALGFVSCATTVYMSPIQSLTLDLGNIIGASTSKSIDVDENAGLHLKVRRITAPSDTGGNGSGITSGRSSSGVDSMRARFEIGQIDNCYIGISATYPELGKFAGVTFKWNATDVSTQQSIELHNCKFPDGAPKLTFNATYSLAAAVLTAVDGNAWDNRRISTSSDVRTDAATYRTAGYRSRKLSITKAGNYTSRGFPLQDTLMQVACKAGVPVTVDVYVMRPATTAGAAISIRSGFVDGVASAQVDASAAANTWEKLTLSFTPTKDGVVPIFANCWGPNGSIAYFTEAKPS